MVRIVFYDIRHLRIIFFLEDVRKSSLELPNFRHHLVPSDNMWNGPPPQKRNNAKPAITLPMTTATNEQ